MTYDGDTLILGIGTVSAEAINAFFRDRGPDYAKTYAPDKTYKPAPPTLGQDIVAVCQQWGLNWDVVAAQIGHESAFTQSRIARDKNNYSGLGAVDNNAYAGAVTFSTPFEGIRATAAHLMTYAVGHGAWTVYDPRASNVPPGNVGTCKTWTSLGGKWATDAGYGGRVVALANRLVTFANDHAWEEPPMSTPYDHIIPGMIDARSQLATATQNQGGVQRGPYETIPLSAKRGVVVHYRGVVTDVNAGLASFKSDATYHVGKNWVSAGQPPVLGSGIMYHIGIDGQGNVYLLRDLNRVLWHCGAWPQNENTLAIQLPLGGNQRATNAQLASLNRVVDAWLAFTKAPDTEVWGHQELSPTTCPGTLMTDFVKPYRNAPPAPSPADEPILVVGNPLGPFGYALGFKGRLQQIGAAISPTNIDLGILAWAGWPAENEWVGEDGCSYQHTERLVLKYTPGVDAPFDITPMLRSVEVMPKRKVS